MLLEDLDAKEGVGKNEEYIPVQMDSFAVYCFEMFNAQVAEEVVDYFFVEEPKINKQMFTIRLKRYAMHRGCKINDSAIDECFDVLMESKASISKSNTLLDISTFGDAI